MQVSMFEFRVRSWRIQPRAQDNRQKWLGVAYVDRNERNGLVDASYSGKLVICTQHERGLILGLKTL